MDFYVSRALQIGCLEGWQMEDLHVREDRRSTCLANFEIQDIYGLASIKERFNIPEDNGLQAQHAARIRARLLSDRIANGETVNVVMNGEDRTIALKPWESLVEGNVMAIHAYDRKVFDAVAGGLISFAFEGGSPKSTGRRMADRFETARVQ